SAEAAPLPDRLVARNHADFLNEWALYLSDLGRLQGAARCYERNIALRLEEGSWKNASTGNQNLTDLPPAAGRLRGGLAAGRGSRPPGRARLVRLRAQGCLRLPGLRSRPPWGDSGRAGRLRDGPALAAPRGRAVRTAAVSAAWRPACLAAGTTGPGRRGGAV